MMTGKDMNVMKYNTVGLPVNSINDNSMWSSQVSVYNHAAVFPVVITHFNALSLCICPIDMLTGSVSGQSVYLQYLCNHIYSRVRQLPITQSNKLNFVVVSSSNDS